jgi:serine/threonine protein kinase
MAASATDYIVVSAADRLAERRRLLTITEAQGTCVTAQVRGTICTVTSTQMPLGPGTRLGPYEILSAIGAGGMGEVYRARDTKLGRDVALKASLNHPHIAAIYGFEDSGETHALVLELVEGETLADRIAHGAIPLNEALPIAKQIAEALEAAHEHGIIHRDQGGRRRGPDRRATAGHRRAALARGDETARADEVAIALTGDACRSRL